MLMLNKHNSSRGKQNVTAFMLRAGKSALLYTLLKAVGTMASGFVQAHARGAAEHIQDSFGIPYNSVLMSYKWEKRVREDEMRFTPDIMDFIKRNGMEKWNECTIELNHIPLSDLDLKEHAEIMEDTDKSVMRKTFVNTWGSYWNTYDAFYDNATNRPVNILQTVLDFLSHSGETKIKFNNKHRYCSGRGGYDAEKNAYHRLLIITPDNGQTDAQLNADIELIKLFVEGQIWPKSFTDVSPQNIAFAKKHISPRAATTLIEKSTECLEREVTKRRKRPLHMVDEMSRTRKNGHVKYRQSGKKMTSPRGIQRLDRHRSREADRRRKSPRPRTPRGSRPAQTPPGSPKQFKIPISDCESASDITVTASVQSSNQSDP